MTEDNINLLAAQTLRKAADRLDTHGWTQGQAGPEEGPNCAYGACMWTLGGHESFRFGTLSSVIEAFDRATGEAMIGGNDRPESTKESVQAKLREAAETLENVYV